MKVTAIIPTCSSSRLGLLMQTIKSIQAGSYKDVHIIVVADGNRTIYLEVLKKKFDNLTVILNKERMDWIFSTNHVLKEFDSEYYIYASDDLFFPPDCLENAMRTMKERFPDGYGLVTMSKKNRCPFGLIGRKFVEHFPDHQVFCPDYFHYCSDTELRTFVRTADLFAFPPERESQVKHHRLNDNTRALARKVRGRDHLARDKRKEKGYLWGENFNLVTR